MATYNGRRFVEEQVVSILRNLRRDDELVVVDDHSSDGTWEFLTALQDERIRPVRNPSNEGVRRTFEKALSLTHNEVVFLSDQDDVWEPGKRDAFVAEFDADPGCMVVVSDAVLIDGAGVVLHRSFMQTRGGFKGTVLDTLIRNRFLGCAMAVRRPVLDAALPIPERVPMHDMWLGAIGSRLGGVRYLSRPFLRYRRHAANVSPQKSQSLPRALRWRIDLFVQLLRRWAELRRRSGR
jgi:glycosyltransferase involved in cell wall biosynthesis